MRSPRGRVDLIALSIGVHWFQDPDRFETFDDDKRANLMALYLYEHSPKPTAGPPATRDPRMLNDPEQIQAMLQRAAARLPR